MATHDPRLHGLRGTVGPDGWRSAAWRRQVGRILMHVVPWAVLAWGVRAQQARVAEGLPRSGALTAFNFLVMLVALYELIVLTLWRMRR